jgi:hypothetical protein
MEERLCWMCNFVLAEDEVQYCSHCEYNMLQILLQEVESDDQAFHGEC